MANKRLRFLAILLLSCISTVGVRAAIVDWNTTGITTIATADSFYADFVGPNDLFISGNVTINGNAWVDASANDVQVYIGEHSGVTPPDTIATLIPDATNGGNLIFHAPVNKKIDIWIPATYDFFTQPNSTFDMNLTFSGAGQTVFHVGGMDPDVTSPNYGYGRVVFTQTNVWITMDQTQAQAETNNENKLVFQRGGYLGGGTWDLGGDYNNTCSGWPVIVQFDPYSNLLYVSPEDNTTPLVNAPVSDGAIAFDPSNAGKGAMELVVTDSAGFVIAGHFMDSVYFGQPFIGALPQVLPPEVSDMRYAAGNRAIFRVIDDLAAAIIGPGYAPDDATRRGLIIVNSNAQHPLLASDPYSFYDLGMSSYFDFAWPNYRKGFILGMNGDVDVYNNRFVHYFSYNTSYDNGPAYNEQAANGIFNTFPAATVPEIYLKKKNPAAFVVDGYNQFTAPFYLAAVDEFPVADYQAQVLLRGDARLHMSAALGEQDPVAGIDAFFQNDIMLNTGYSNGWGLAYDLYPDTDLNYYFSGVTGGDPALLPPVRYGASFNGDWVSLDFAQTMSGEGIHVLDVEGQVDVRSLDSSPNVGSVAKEGVINLASMELDYLGQEATYEWNSATQRYDRYVFTRPLDYQLPYPVYRSGSMLFNDVTNFYDVEIRHNDVLKRVIDRPVYCEPAMVGGDRKFYWGSLLGYNGAGAWPPVEFPELRLYNSSLTMHESLSPAGIRFVVKQYYVPGADAPNDQIDNNSSFVFYNHGDDKDMQWRGYARAFVLGNPHNYMADGTPNWVLESAYVDVFRSRNLPVDPVTTDPVDRVIKLSLQQDDSANIRALGDKKEGTQLFLFTKGPVGMSAMSLGWTSTFGYDETSEIYNPYYKDLAVNNDKWYWRPMPWSSSGGLVPSAPGDPAVFVDLDASSKEKSLPEYALDHTKPVSPGIVSIDGNLAYDDTWIYFGSKKYYYGIGDAPRSYWVRDWQSITDSYKVRFPVVYPYASPVFYVNHGGKLTITNYNDCIFDTAIASRLWYDYLSTDWESKPESERYTILSGIVDLPHDQVTFTGNGNIQPYAYGAAMQDVAAKTGGILRLKAYMPERTTAWDRASGEEMTIDWAQRPIDYNQAPFKTISKTIKRVAKRTVATRATQPVLVPQEMPRDLLYFAEGDHITQLRVAGATQADPFHIFVTGAATTHGFAIIDEIVSVKTENLMALPPITDMYSSNYQRATYGEIPGEGGHGVILFDADGSVGLGSRAWNEHSVSAWNKLGRDYVTLAPMGFGKVVVNSDLLVVDPLAVIPVVGFGEVLDESVLVDNSFERLTFYAEDEHEIRVPTNGTLDLRAFGKSTLATAEKPVRQELAFSGKVKLVLEPGAIIRFPENVDENVTFVLYFNDESQLVFDGSKEHGAARFISADDANGKRVKLMGKGQIWVNKDAKVKVNNASWVGVQADNDNPNTDITISLKRQGSMEIGTDQIAGGAFEVGNIFDSLGEHTIKFALRLDGPFSEFHIDREGFFGLGAGIINKEGNINGDALASQNPASFNPTTGLYVFNPDPLKAWEVHPLYDVQNITIDIIKGAFDNSNIFDGSDSRASLIAVGGFPEGVVGGSTTYNFNINDPDKAIIRGGGNMMFIPCDHEPMPVNVWAWAGRTEEEPEVPGVRYGILASEAAMYQWGQDDFVDSTVVQDEKRKEFTATTGSAYDFFTFMSYQRYNNLSIKRICVGQTQFEIFDDYMYLTYLPLSDLYDDYSMELKDNLVDPDSYANYDQTTLPHYLIIREESPHATEGGVVEDGLHKGALGATGDNVPSQYTVPNGPYTH